MPDTSVPQERDRIGFSIFASFSNEKSSFLHVQQISRRRVVNLQKKKQKKKHRTIVYVYAASTIVENMYIVYLI